MPGRAGSAVVAQDKGIIPGFPVANRAGRALAAAEQSGLSRLHSCSREREAAGGRKTRKKGSWSWGEVLQGGRAVPAPQVWRVREMGATKALVNANIEPRGFCRAELFSWAVHRASGQVWCWELWK